MRKNSNNLWFWRLKKMVILIWWTRGLVDPLSWRLGEYSIIEYLLYAWCSGLLRPDILYPISVIFRWNTIQYPIKWKQYTVSRQKQFCPSITSFDVFSKKTYIYSDQDKSWPICFVFLPRKFGKDWSISLHTCKWCTKPAFIVCYN